MEAIPTIMLPQYKLAQMIFGILITGQGTLSGDTSSSRIIRGSKYQLPANFRGGEVQITMIYIK